jgi:hypothetical protein
MTITFKHDIHGTITGTMVAIMGGTWLVSHEHGESLVCRGWDITRYDEEPKPVKRTWAKNGQKHSWFVEN